MKSSEGVFVRPGSGEPAYRPIGELPDAVPDRIWLEKGQEGLILCWTFDREVDPTAEEAMHRKTDEHLLSQFLELAKTSESDAGAFRIFARQHGVLYLCHHERPYQHALAASGEAADRTCKPTGREPLRVWRGFAREVAAILRTSRALQSGELGYRADWDTIFGQAGAGLWESGKVFEARSLLSMKVTRWLYETRVMPVVRWSEEADEKPKIRLGGTGVLAAVARQLAFGVCRVNALVICAECGEPFTPSRRPDPNRDSYCPGCREDGAPQRAARRRYARRKRAEKSDG